MKRKKFLVNLALVLLIFILLTAISALFDADWLGNTFSTAEEALGWAVGGLFGAVLLLYIGKGLLALARLLIARFAIVPVERILLAVLFLACIAYLAFDGFIDSAAGLAAAVLLGILGAAALFWLWRRLKHIFIRVVLGDESYDLTNLEYFAILILSLGLALALAASEPGMFEGENLPSGLIVAALLTIVFGVCLYWFYVAVKAAVRRGRYAKTPVAYDAEDFVYRGLTRTFRIPLASIYAVEKTEAYAGLAAIPSLYHAPRKTELLVIYSRARKKPFAIPSPGEEAEKELAQRVRGQLAIEN